MNPTRFDAIVVGTGQAGKPLAAALADAGHETAVVEMARVGGTCVVDGCTPSKTLIASARVAHVCARALVYGIEAGTPRAHMDAVIQRKREVVDTFVESSRKSLQDHRRVALLHGRARFLDAHTMTVEPNADERGRARTITADRIFLDVGGRPAIPDIAGLDSVPYLDSSSAMELEELPEHLVIVGGGAVAVELGQAFRRFGAHVTIVERAPRLLPGEDEDVGTELRTILEAEGLTVMTGCETVSVEDSDGRIDLSVRSPDGMVHAVGSHLLVAVGRVPNSDLLDAAKAGLELDDRGFIPVDEHCRTRVEGIWAMGDMTGGRPFTHVSYDDYRVVAADVLPDRPARTRDRTEPYAIFTDPEIGRVGLDERTARHRGLPYRRAKLPMSSVARAIETDEKKGFMKCLIDADSDRILGATIMAARGGEVMTMLQVAMLGDLPYTALRDAVIAHPTWSESVQNLFARVEAVEAEERHDA